MIKIPVIACLLASVSLSLAAQESPDEHVQETQPADPQEYSTLPRGDALQKIHLVFDNLYQQTEMLPSVSSSYFHESSLYDLYALPLTLTSARDGVQFEVFGQLFDQRSQLLSNMSQDAVLYSYMERRQDYQRTDVALGFGFGYEMSKDVLLKTLFSTGSIPGYGDSNLAIGVEVAY